ncbi:MAG: tetratricopeptide repeat protein, partial [Nitrososphaera sp.]
AKMLYQLSLRVNPNDPVTHFIYAGFLSETEEYQEALRSYKAALDLNSKYVSALQAYAILLSEQGPTDKAKLKFEEALELDPNNVPVLSAYAVFLSKRKSSDSWREAERLFQRALQIEPNHIQSLISYALLLKRIKRLEDADKKFSKAVSTGDRLAAQAYGVFLQEQRKYDLAKELFDRAFYPNPRQHKQRLHNAMVSNAYAILLDKMAAPLEEIAKRFEMALSLKPVDRKSIFHLVLTHKRYGEILCKHQKYTEAGQHFEAAIKLERENTYVRNSYARCLMQQGHFEAALAQYEIVLERFGTQEHALGGAAKALCELNRYPEAFKYFERALTNNRNNIHILFPYLEALIDVLARQRGEGTIDQALADRAIEIRDQLRKLRPGNPRVKRLSDRLQQLGIDNSG